MEKIFEGKKEEKIRELILIILNSKPTGVPAIPPLAIEY